MNTTRRGFLVSASGLVLTAGLPALPRAAGYRTEAVQEVIDGDGDGDGVLALITVERCHNTDWRMIVASVVATDPVRQRTERWMWKNFFHKNAWLRDPEKELRQGEQMFVASLVVHGINYVRPVEYPAGTRQFERIYWKRIRG